MVINLPNGPTAHFKLSSLLLSKEIPNHASFTFQKPEIIMNNFNTRLGHTIGRFLASMFPINPQFHGRRVVTFHNQRDFIFFRHHRYIFDHLESEKTNKKINKTNSKVRLQEIGPRFCLKLRSLQHGTFDPASGEYEWLHKVFLLFFIILIQNEKSEMDTSRRRFFL